MKIFCDRFEARSKIGAGSFGTVYVGIDKKNHDKIVALKIEENRDFSIELINEYNSYRMLKCGPGIAKCYWYGHHHCEKNILVMELLGKTLQQHFRELNYKFTLKTNLMITNQIITILEFVHVKGLLHRDIKPSNFAMGLGSKSNEVFLIDFGFAQQYLDEESKKHIEYKENFRGVVGTTCYASINSLLGVQLSRRDDLESLAYMLLYFVTGDLPWREIIIQHQNQKKKVRGHKEKLYKEVCHKKMSTSIEELCKDSPIEFGILLNYSKKLEFTEAPNYAYLKRLFHTLYQNHGYSHDNKFDWMEVSQASECCQNASEDESTDDSKDIVASDSMQAYAKSESIVV